MPKLTQNEMFDSRDTLEEALAYAQNLILAKLEPGQDTVAALTAVHVVSNTAIQLLEKSSQFPTDYPSEEELARLETLYVDDMQLQDCARAFRASLPGVMLTAAKLNRTDPQTSEFLKNFVFLGMRFCNMSREDIVAESLQLLKEPRS